MISLSAYDDSDWDVYSFTVVHPVPTFDNTTQLMQVLDRMEEGTFSPLPRVRINAKVYTVGLYLMYDMRL